MADRETRQATVREVTKSQTRLSDQHFHFSGSQLISNVISVSHVQQDISVIRVSILFQIIFPLWLLQNIEQSSLCYGVGPY